MATASSEPATTNISNTTCLELALHGEYLARNGKLKESVEYFEEAIKAGPDDPHTRSAIYSQLGNAYFYLEDFQKALEYHKKDVKLVNDIGDLRAEAKACGNLGNVLKMLDKFDEAAVYCRRHLELSKKLNDEEGESRAHYNLGNVYYTQGRRMKLNENGELTDEAKSILRRAIEYYETNLDLVSKTNDSTSMGRAIGNIGNIHYMLDNFELAVKCHEKRLALALQTNDKSAQRRAHINLGNANIFIKNFPVAVEHYSATLKLAQELKDKSTEALACEHLANTYSILSDFQSAITYHLKFLELIKEFDDKLGEGRACWSLVNNYQMVNDPESALSFAKRHLDIAKMLGDEAGRESAESNIEELTEILAQKQAAQMSSQHNFEQPNKFRLTPDKRQDQEQRRFKKQLNSHAIADIDGLAARRKGRGTVKSSSSERLFDMIAHFQSGRIDDQRCEILPSLNTNAKSRIAYNDKENSGDMEPSNRIAESGGRGSSSRGSQPSMTNPLSAVSAAASAIKKTYRKASLSAYPTIAPSIHFQRRPTVSAEHREELFDLIAGAQGQRMDEQRASLPALTLANGVLKNPRNANLLSRGHTIDHSTSAKIPMGLHVETVPESIPEIVSKKEKSHSITPQVISNNTFRASTTKPKLSRHFQTVDSSEQSHNGDLFDNLMKYQSTRLNDQRSEIPKTGLRSSQPDNNKNQEETFLNLISKCQSSRIDDQRSAPPAKNKNV
ncbi:hypothetical protein SUGI_1515180 [Cryptomeria japonica]|uniref:Uncharacterized protein n=1 Tax=Cryptomeria japonica TaxID=3369 RepID=A0AAD3NUL7_CRYJA|nr:uncharacterized protein LOC131873350 [Cryptomeria japonica]GLJ59583.1 hypothetical protein SUGI_1515180 [Cryptomeria japonica]